jgi:4a-hydroxytetrahydrobiopterin dehydratase
MTKLTGPQIQEKGLDAWVLLVGGLQTRARTGDFATGVRLVDAVGRVAEEQNHHPDVDLRYSYVDLRLSSHDAGGVTERDVLLARSVEAIAAALGVRLDKSGLSRLELALDSPDHGVVLPFWAAVWGVEPPDGASDELADPSGVLPALWFQPSGSEEARQRWHPDLWVDPSEVPARIEAAVAAGGAVVSERWAPSFWVLADPDGNRVCLCTWQEREPD